MNPPRSTLALVTLGALTLIPRPGGAQLLPTASRVVRTGSSRGSARGSSGGEASSGGGPVASSMNHADACGALVMPYPYAFGDVPDWNWATARRCWWQPPTFVGAAAPATTATRAVFGVEGGWVLSTVGRAAISARFDLASFELSVRYAGLFERVQGRNESVVLGRADVGLRVSDTQNLDARLRLGLTHWIDRAGHNFGVAAGVAVDAFPGAPWVLSVEAGGGSLGRAGIVQARATVGVMVSFVELGLGWDHTSLVTNDGSPHVHLTGPIAITRIWR